jgi:hypothetical protein
MLSVITNKEKWDSIVKSFSGYDVYYLSGYSNSFRLHGDGEPVLLFYESCDIRAINVVMKRDVAKDKHFAGKLKENTYFDIITPYGYGGFLVEGRINEHSLGMLFCELEEFCIRENIICEFVRLSPIHENYRYYIESFECKKIGNTLYMELGQPEQIWGNLKSECRNRVRKAIKNGVSVVKDTEFSTLGEFINIYKETMVRDKADPYYFFSNIFFQSLTSLKENALIYNAIYDNKIISSILVIYCKENAHYHLGGSLSDYMKLGANNLIFYEAACDLHNMGCTKLHLGGGYGSQNDSLLSYKKKFNKKGLIDYYIARKVFIHDAYNMLIDLRRNIDNHNFCSDMADDFFPRYRAGVPDPKAAPSQANIS